MSWLAVMVPAFIRTGNARVSRIRRMRVMDTAPEQRVQRYRNCRGNCQGRVQHAEPGFFKATAKR